MKKLSAYIILSILMILVSCSQTADTKTIKIPPDLYALKLTEENIDTETFKFNIYTLDNDIVPMTYQRTKAEKDMANENWNDFLAKEYGIEINNINIYAEYSGWIKSITSVNIPTLFGMGMDNGIFTVDIDTFQDLLKNNTLAENFIPLSQFYVSNPELAEIPREYTELTVDIDGNTWGMAFDYNDSQMTGRFYNRSMLESLNAEAPKTIDEFYELCITSKRLNPDASVLDIWNNRYGNRIYAISDILGAYNIYAGSYSGCMKTIQYRSDTNSIEDLMLSEELRTAFEYVRGLLKIGVIRESFGGNFDYEITKGNLMSYYSSARKPERFNINSVFSPYLEQEGFEPYYKYNKSSKVMIMAENTENPGRVFSEIAGMIYKSSSYLPLRYGKAYETSIKDGNSVVSYEKEQVPYPMAAGVFSDRGFLQCETNDGNFEENSINELQLIADAAVSDRIQKAAEQFNMYDYIVTAPVSSDKEYMWSVYIFRGILNQIIYDRDISLDDLYDEYFKKINEIGASEYMIYINEKAGTVWQNHYD